MRTIGFLVIGLWVLASDYAIKTVKVQPIETYPARAALAGVTIPADPYATDEKTLTAFDIKDLNTRGYHAVHLTIQNSSKDSVTIRTRNITVTTADGQASMRRPRRSWCRMRQGIDKVSSSGDITTRCWGHSLNPPRTSMS